MQNSCRTLRSEPSFSMDIQKCATLNSTSFFLFCQPIFPAQFVFFSFKEPYKKPFSPALKQLPGRGECYVLSQRWSAYYKPKCALIIDATVSGCS